VYTFDFTMTNCIQVINYVCIGFTGDRSCDTETVGGISDVEIN